MKKSEVENLASALLRNILKLDNFKKYRYGAVYEDGYKYLVIGIASFDSDNSFPTTFSYSFGLFQLKYIGMRIFPDLYKVKGNEYPNIVSASQRRLFEESKYPLSEYDIRNEEQIPHMIDEIVAYLRKEVFPIFFSIDSIGKLEALVNRTKPRVKNFSGLYLSKLIDEDRYCKVKDDYLEISKNWPEWDVEDLMKAIDFLDRHTTEEVKKIADLPN